MNQPFETSAADAVQALVLWIQDTAIRVAAIEALTREKLNISNAEWSGAVQKAAEHWTTLPPPSVPQPDPFVVFSDFLKRARSLWPLT